MDSCERQFCAFQDIVSDLMTVHFPEKLVKVHEKDKPWITEQFRLAMRERQKAWASGRMADYRLWRNKVSHMNKNLRSSCIRGR